jgi:hypothetical protein
MMSAGFRPGWFARLDRTLVVSALSLVSTLAGVVRSVDAQATSIARTMPESTVVGEVRLFIARSSFDRVRQHGRTDEASLLKTV